MPISIKCTWNYLIISGYSYQQFSHLSRNFKFTLHDQIATQTKKILSEHVYFMLTAQWYTTGWLFDLYWDDNNWGHSAQSYSQFRADKFGTRHPVAILQQGGNFSHVDTRKRISPWQKVESEFGKGWTGWQKLREVYTLILKESQVVDWSFLFSLVTLTFLLRKQHKMCGLYCPNLLPF